MNANQNYRHALKIAAATCLCGGFLSVHQGQAAIIDTYFTLNITTAANASTATTAYDLPRGTDSYYTGTEEYGAQVSLTAGAPNVLKGISFYYFSDYVQFGGLTYRIYANDGPLVNGLPSPGTKLATKTADILGSPSGNIVQYSAGFDYLPSNIIPTTLTITLEFAGQSATQHAGWLTSDQLPSVGSHPVNQFWSTSDHGVTWDLNALVPVPEVNSAAVVAGVLGVFGAVRIYRRSKLAAR